MNIETRKSSKKKSSRNQRRYSSEDSSSSKDSQDFTSSEQSSSSNGIINGESSSKHHHHQNGKSKNHKRSQKDDNSSSMDDDEYDSERDIPVRDSEGVKPSLTETTIKKFKLARKYYIKAREHAKNNSAKKRPLTHSQTIGNGERLRETRMIDSKLLASLRLEANTNTAIYSSIHSFVSTLLINGIDICLKGMQCEVDIFQMYDTDSQAAITNFVRQYVWDIMIQGFCVYRRSMDSDENDLPIPVVCEPSTWALAFGIRPSDGLREYRILKRDLHGPEIGTKASSIPISMLGAIDNPDKIWTDAYLSMINQPLECGSLTSPMAASMMYTTIHKNLLGCTMKGIHLQGNPIHVSTHVPNADQFKNRFSAPDALSLPTSYAERDVLTSREQGLMGADDYEMDQQGRERHKIAIAQNILESNGLVPSAVCPLEKSIRQSNQQTLQNVFSVPIGKKIETIRQNPLDGNIPTYLNILHHSFNAVLGGTPSNLPNGTRKFAANAGLEMYHQGMHAQTMQDHITQQLSQALSNMLVKTFRHATAQDFDDKVKEKFGTEFVIDHAVESRLDEMIHFIEQLGLSFRELKLRAEFTFKTTFHINQDVLTALYDTGVIDHHVYQDLCLSYYRLAPGYRAKFIDEVQQKFLPQYLVPDPNDVLGGESMDMDDGDVNKSPSVSERDHLDDDDDDDNNQKEVSSTTTTNKKSSPPKRGKRSARTSVKVAVAPQKSSSSSSSKGKKTAQHTRPENPVNSIKI